MSIDKVYSFLPSYGLATIVDPEFTLLIDVICGHYTGDAFKLYNFFQKKDQNGMVGVFATCLIYAIFTAIAIVTLYQYITKIHRQGRVKDTHRRLTADEPDFFVPIDSEVSFRYLKWVCYKAKLFKGDQGQTRRVQVTEFIVDQESQTAIKKLAQLGDVTAGIDFNEEEEDDADLGLDRAKAAVARIFKRKRTAVMTYVCIHTINPETMSHTLYRHFMRYPSGAICELSPKEPANMHMTNQNPPTTVTRNLYEDTTNEPIKAEEIPLSEWLKESFDDKPPILSTGRNVSSKVAETATKEPFREQTSRTTGSGTATDDIARNTRLQARTSTGHFSEDPASVMDQRKPDSYEENDTGRVYPPSQKPTWKDSFDSSLVQKGGASVDGEAKSATELEE